MKQHILQITEADCLEEQELLRYAEGSEDVALVRRVELHLSDCMMCSDALEGLQTVDNQHFVEFNKNIHREIRDIYAPAKVVSLRKYIPLAAAASLLLGIGFWFWKTPQNVENPIVLSEKKQDTISNILQNEDSVKLQKAAIVADTKDISKPSFPAFENTQKPTIAPIVAADVRGSVAQADAIVAVEKIPQNSDNQEIKSEYTNFKEAVTEESKPIQSPVKNEEVVLVAPSNNDNYENKANMPLPAPNQNSNSNSNIFSQKARSIYKKPKVETVKPSAKTNANAKQNIQFPNQEERLLEQGVKYYTASDYKSALLTFEIILKKSPKNEAATFYKGATQCADNQCIEGINTLSIFVSSYPETSVFYAEAAWLTANCQLSSMQRETAKLLLQQLSDYYNPRQDDAKKLLEKLKK
jgi:TolA-binding protein